MNAYQNKKIYFQFLVNQSVSKTSETTNRVIFTETKILVHFYKKNSRTPSLFSMTFHDFPGIVVTLISAVAEWMCAILLRMVWP